MDTAIWGKGFWLMIWILLYNPLLYNNDIVKLKKYLDVINRNLPCDECRKHIKQKVLDNNIMSTDSLSKIKEFYFDVYNSTANNKITLKL